MKTLSVINEIKIVQLANDLVPIKPICEALGIDESAQRKKIQEDEYFSSTAVLSTAVGADKKEREMLCLPLPYIFSWLATINPKNVKEEARAAVQLYRMKCSQVIYEAMFLKNKFLQEKDILIEEKLKELESIRDNFKNAKLKLDDATKELKEARTTTFDDWQKNNNQGSMFDIDGFIE
ncbi:MAG: hypothetical protein B7Y83_00335 [Flavobacteriales bacterium 32-34-25]|nr:MAG: hypothetical protein B7Y83_00335 [Flavobacteriales bacterium 32-34-25]